MTFETASYFYSIPTGLDGAPVKPTSQSVVLSWDVGSATAFTTNFAAMCNHNEYTSINSFEVFTTQIFEIRINHFLIHVLCINTFRQLTSPAYTGHMILPKYAHSVQKKVRKEKSEPHLQFFLLPHPWTKHRSKFSLNPHG